MSALKGLWFSPVHALLAVLILQYAAAGHLKSAEIADQPLPVRDTPLTSPTVGAPQELPTDLPAAPLQQQGLEKPLDHSIAEPTTVEANAPGKTGTAADELLAPATQPTRTPPVALAEPPAAQPPRATAAPIPVEAANFNGLQPGTSTVADADAAFGKPKQSSQSGDSSTLVYAFEPFTQVEVTAKGGTIDSITVQLHEPFTTESLIEQLQLEDVRPVIVEDEVGRVLGHAFPERGVLFGLTENGQVTHILLEAIGPLPFLLRAENNFGTADGLSLADIDQALKLDPQAARAHWLKARVLTDLGRFEEALQSSEQAVTLEPSSPAYQLQRAEVLKLCGKQAEAAEQIKELLADERLQTHLKAQAMCLLGDVLASGEHPDYQQAMDFHSGALKLAMGLSGDRQTAVRRAAKTVAVQAHLSIARDVARGDWQRKLEAVPKWLAKASELAEDLITTESASADLRLRVARAALGSYCDLQGKVDADQWKQYASRVGGELLAECTDDLRRERLQWELGAALGEAVNIDAVRRQHRQALETGKLAAEYLIQGGTDRQVGPADAELLGHLYYRLGVIHALEQGDHKTAVQWYEKALPLLDLAKPAATEFGRRGEFYVSMGVSYWQAGNRDEALRLTREGADLMTSAVEKRQLDRSALSVPYGNLASMHHEMGNGAEAQQFATLAATSEKGDVQQAGFESPAEPRR